MRLVNAEGRTAFAVDGRVFDVQHLSGGRLPVALLALLEDENWDTLGELHAQGSFDGGTEIGRVALGPPLPRPASIVCVIANHPPAERLDFPMIVGKASSSVVGPYDEVVLPDPGRLPLGQAFVIPEPELGVVTRPGGKHLDVDAARRAIAGYVIAQDITERRHEFGASRPPWSPSDLPAKTLGKSFDTFCPTGPALVTLDELDDPNNLRTQCWINGERVFDYPTADLLWNAAELIALLSAFMTLPAGLLCLSGCGPTATGAPIPTLAPGDEIRTEITHLGSMVNRCAAE